MSIRQLICWLSGWPLCHHVPLQMSSGEIYLGWPSVEFEPEITLSSSSSQQAPSSGPFTMVAFEPRDPQSCRPLSNVSEENAGIPWNRAELEGEMSLSQS